MAPLVQPTIPQGVYNRLPFLEVGAANLALINDFTVDAMSYFKEPLELDDTEYLDLVNYPICLKSVIPDLVALAMLNREVMRLMAGKSDTNGSDGIASTPQGKTIKRAKAGEAEVEYMFAKAGEGGLISDYKTMMGQLIGSATSKAAACGYCLVFDGANLCSCTCMTDGGLSMKTFDWCD